MADKLLGRKTNLTTDLLRPFEGSLDRKDPIYDSESEVFFVTFYCQVLRCCALVFFGTLCVVLAISLRAFKC